MRPSLPALATPPPGVQRPAVEGSSAAQRSIAVIGDAWTLRILRTVFRGQRRYGDFIQEFGVSRAVLTDRLNKLVAHGVLLRDTRQGGHPDYRLTECGLDLWPMFLAMWVWETDWGTGQDQDTWAPDLPRRQVAHSVCGHAMRPQFKCLHCHQAVLPFETAASQLNPTRGATTSGAASPAVTSAFRRARQETLHSTASLRAQRLARVIGDRWNSAVVAAAFRAVRTFSGFAQDLGIGPAQLSARLAELQQLGILSSRTYAGSRQEYRLTQAGIALFPVTLELVRWGNRWLWPQEPAFTVQHLLCHHTLQARWHCGHCEAELVRETVRFS